MATTTATRPLQERERTVLAPPVLSGSIPTIARPVWKRMMDVTGAAIGLTLLTPVFLVLAVAVMLDSRGGAFFRQTRVGHGGRCFTCWKFRSMRRGSDLQKMELLSQNEANGRIFKMQNDPRCTRVGRFLRKTSLDELPQLINVLRGDMSLVGPRPPLVSEVIEYEPEELARLAATPGMTGLWQVTLRGRHDFADMVALDTEYAENLSLWLDVKILARTVPTVIFGRGSC